MAARSRREHDENFKEMELWEHLAELRSRLIRSVGYIAIGMVAAARLARALGTVNDQFVLRLCGLIERAALPTSFAGTPDLFDRVLRAMQMDKKFRNGQNLFVLPTGIGTWVQREGVDWSLVHEAVRSMLASSSIA